MSKAIEAFLANPSDTTQLQELKRASSLVEAPKIEDLVRYEQLVRLQKGKSDKNSINSANRDIKLYKSFRKLIKIEIIFLKN